MNRLRWTVHSLCLIPCSSIRSGMISLRWEDINTIRSWVLPTDLSVVVDEDVIDPNTGEVLAEKGQKIDKDLAMQIEDVNVEFVMVQSPMDETGSHRR